MKAYWFNVPVKWHGNSWRLPSIISLKYARLIEASDIPKLPKTSKYVDEDGIEGIMARFSLTKLDYGEASATAEYVLNRFLSEVAA